MPGQTFVTYPISCRMTRPPGSSHTRSLHTTLHSLQGITHNRWLVACLRRCMSLCAPRLRWIPQCWLLCRVNLQRACPSEEEKSSVQQVAGRYMPRQIATFELDLASDKPCLPVAIIFKKCSSPFFSLSYLFEKDLRSIPP